jgi:predicted nucleic acid-binding Zn finger protein
MYWASFTGVSVTVELVQMPVDRLLEKAKRLVESRRVESLGQGVYNVIGDHGTYTVVQDYTGKLSCSCPGFLKKARCSHVTAVMLLTKVKRRKKSGKV